MKRNTHLVSVGMPCSNGIIDPGETDVDCGGTCVPEGKKCQNGQRCVVGSDCISNYCVNGICTCKYRVFFLEPKLYCISIAPSCFNGISDPGETDIDCGGVCVAQGRKCQNGQKCILARDCISNVCYAGFCISKYCSVSRNG